MVAGPAEAAGLGQADIAGVNSLPSKLKPASACGRGAGDTAAWCLILSGAQYEWRLLLHALFINVKALPVIATRTIIMIQG